MRSAMSVEAKRELLFQVAPRYREATHKEKSNILNEFLASTGYARKYGIRLLGRPVRPPVESPTDEAKAVRPGGPRSAGGGVVGGPLHLFQAVDTVPT